MKSNLADDEQNNSKPVELIVKKRQNLDYDNPNKLVVMAHEKKGILDEVEKKEGDQTYKAYIGNQVDEGLDLVQRKGS